MFYLLFYEKNMKKYGKIGGEMREEEVNFRETLDGKNSCKR